MSAKRVRSITVFGSIALLFFLAMAEPTPAQSAGAPKQKSAKSKRESDGRVSGKSKTGTKNVNEGQREPFAAVANLIRATVRFGPTLVVWIMDRTDSSVALSKAVGADVQTLYQEMASEGLLGDSGQGEGAQLLTSVISFGAKVEVLIDQPTSDFASISDAFSRIRSDDSGREVPFAAVKAALDKFSSIRTSDRREVLFIVVTNEAGDDSKLVEEILPRLERSSIPVYVMGAPAPFGKLAALSQFTEGPTDFQTSDATRTSVHHGPESREPEVVEFGFLGQGFLGEVFESGFGPFELERVCRRSGGKFLMLGVPAIDPRNRAEINQRWPSPDAVRFEAPPARYAPDYVSEQRYQQLIAENKARAAVIKASKFNLLDAPFAPRLEFEKRSEAELNQILTQAQQAAAKLSPIVEQLYQAIQEGDSDRAKLTGARWQASFDLAMGRAAAAKANVDGYNAMLAELKRKSDFKSPNSMKWVLERSDSIEAGSALQKLIDKARQSLGRVVQEHPGTPWARIAEQELKTQIGWKWTER